MSFKFLIQLGRKNSLKLQFSILILLLVLVAPIGADPAYLTLVSADSTAPLQKTDLTVTIEKTTVPIQNLFFVDTAKRSNDLLFRSAGRRCYVLLFDLIFNSPEELLQARKAAETFLSKVPTEDLVAVAGINPKDGLKWTSTFTADRNKTVMGINAFGKEKSETLLKGPEGNYYPKQFSPSPKAVELDPDATFLQTMTKINVADGKKREQLIPVVLQGLVDLGFLLSTIDGRKNVLFFTNGFDTGGLSVDLGLQDKAPTRMGDKPAAPDPLAEHKDYDAIISTQIDPEALSKAGPSGRRTKSVGVEALPDLLQGSDAHFHIFHTGAKEYGFLKQLSEKTQGSYSHQTDPGAYVDQTLSSDQTYYVIEWVPNLAELKHLNAVRIEAPNNNLSSSEKWLARKQYPEYSPVEKETHIAVSMYTNYNSDGGKESFWNDFVFEDGISKIVSFVQMDGSQVLQHKAAKNATYELFGFSVDQDQSVVDFSSNTLELDLSNKNLAERLGKSGIKVWNVLLGDKNTESVRCVLVHSETGDTISRSVPMQISESDLTMSSPFFPALSFDWVLWPKPDQDQAKRGIPVHFPYRVDQNFFFPDLTPRVKKTEKDRVFYVKFYNILPESKNPPISIFLVDSAGKSIEISQFALMRKPNQLDHGGMELFWKLQALPDVAPGTYQLKVQIRDTIRNKVVERQVPIEITL